MGVAGKHGARDVPGDAHDDFVACAGLRKLGDERMAVIVPPSDDLRLVAHLVHAVATSLRGWWGRSAGLSRQGKHTTPACTHRTDGCTTRRALEGDLTVSFSGSPGPCLRRSLICPRELLLMDEVDLRHGVRATPYRAIRSQIHQRAGYMFLLRSFAASASMRAFSSAVGGPGDGGGRVSSPSRGAASHE